ncbi:hypothetical protein GCM10010433_67520 [Streptomyces pulveraceus]
MSCRITRRDVGSIFLAMVIGMARGARFYTPAAVGAVVICAVVNARTHTPVGIRIHVRVGATRVPATAIATAHGGRLELDNRPGEGRTCRLLLPGPAIAPGDDTGAAHSSGVRNERLLRRDTRGSGPPSPTPRPPRPDADRVRRRRPW